MPFDIKAFVDSCVARGFGCLEIAEDVQLEKTDKNVFSIDLRMNVGLAPEDRQHFLSESDGEVVRVVFRWEHGSNKGVLLVSVMDSIDSLPEEVEFLEHIVKERNALPGRISNIFSEFDPENGLVLTCGAMFLFTDEMFKKLFRIKVRRIDICEMVECLGIQLFEDLCAINESTDEFSKDDQVPALLN